MAKTEKHNEAFREKVLENKMFDAYDKNIIMAHLSNFYCVFQLGYDEGKSYMDKKLEEKDKTIKEFGDRFVKLKKVELNKAINNHKVSK